MYKRNGEVMKKGIAEIIKLLIGFILGIVVVFQFSTDKAVRSFFEDDIEIERVWQWKTDMPLYLQISIYALVSLVFVLLVTYMIRFFTNTKNVKKTAAFLNIFIQLILGIPITAIIYILFDDIMSTLELEVLYKIAIGALIYAVFFEIICYIFEKAFYDKLKKGHKRCKLIVCNVVSDSAYEDGDVIIQKKTFEECYAVLRNNCEIIKIRQFFKIEELNWSGKKVVDSWRYYRNGDFIQETDEELCKKLMVSEYSSKVQWQG